MLVTANLATEGLITNIFILDGISLSGTCFRLLKLFYTITFTTRILARHGTFYDTFVRLIGVCLEILYLYAKNAFKTV